MKKTLLIALMACSCMMASAKSLVLKMTDGTEVYYLLGGETTPVMKIVEGQVVVNADTYEFSGIDRFYISATDNPVGIKDMSGTLYTKAGGTLHIYTLDGKQVQAPTSNVDGIEAVDTNQLPAGAYIINVNGKSIKFLKK